AIGEIDRIKALDNCSFYSSNLIQQRCKKGSIYELGDGVSVNPESFLNLDIDLVTISGFNQLPPWAQRANHVGCKSLRIWEWREPNPLGRAEWIIAFGYLSNRVEEAKKEFSEELKRYKELLALIQGGGKRIFAGDEFQGIWYCPGGNSFLANLFSQAGMEYVFNGDTSVGSISLKAESAIEKLSGADAWIYHGRCESIKCLLEQESRLSFARDRILSNVWAPIKKKTSYGANKFWEDAIVYPSTLLKDYITIAEDLPENTTYYQKLE
ncbi:MAG: hypothetical protein ACPF8V_11720, partial [Luteibaculum sp.]